MDEYGYQYENDEDTKRQQREAERAQFALMQKQLQQQKQLDEQALLNQQKKSSSNKQSIDWAEISGYNKWKADEIESGIYIDWNAENSHVPKDTVQGFGLATQKGCPPGVSSINDPVNSSTGNFVYTKTDIEIQGQYPLVFKRFYNALDNYPNAKNIIGKNWTHSYNIFLTKSTNKRKKFQITFDDGHVENYYLGKDGNYASYENHLNTLSYDDEFLLTFPNMETYHFDDDGKFTTISDLNGIIATLTYNGNGLLDKISTKSGSLSFVYNERNKLVEVVDHTGRKVSFDYSGDKLTTVTHPTGAVYHYKYNEDGLFILL